MTHSHEWNTFLECADDYSNEVMPVNSSLPRQRRLTESLNRNYVAISSMQVSGVRLPPPMRKFRQTVQLIGS